MTFVNKIPFSDNQSEKSQIKIQAKINLKNKNKKQTLPPHSVENFIIKSKQK